jgi:hypothetical protein
LWCSFQITPEQDKNKDVREMAGLRRLGGIRFLDASDCLSTVLGLKSTDRNYCRLEILVERIHFHGLAPRHGEKFRPALHEVSLAAAERLHHGREKPPKHQFEDIVTKT